MKYTYRMKDLPVSERPYERCEQHGPKVLSDAELLAVVIKNGTKNRSAYEVATDLLSQTKGQGLKGLHSLSLSQLQKVSGIGRVKAIELQCVLELCIRLAKCKNEQTQCFLNPESIAAYYMEEYRNLSQEHVLIIFLNTKNQKINELVISKGTVNSSLISPREVMIEAVKQQAVYLILLHNHPSGDPTPSKADILLTNRVKEAGDIVGIPLIDHIILGDREYISLKQQALM